MRALTMVTRCLTTVALLLFTSTATASVIYEFLPTTCSPNPIRPLSCAPVSATFTFDDSVLVDGIAQGSDGEILDFAAEFGEFSFTLADAFQFRPVSNYVITLSQDLSTIDFFGSSFIRPSFVLGPPIDVGGTLFPQGELFLTTLEFALDFNFHPLGRGPLPNNATAFGKWQRVTGVSQPIPEPGTLLLLGSGVVGMGAAARRRSRGK